MHTHWIGITLGDPAGIGPEVVLKGLKSFAHDSRARFLIVAEPGILDFYQNRLHLKKFWTVVSSLDSAKRSGGKVFCLDPKIPFDLSSLHPGRLQKDCGRYAVESLLAASRWAKKKKLDALVTAPLNKKAMHLAGYRFEGQTELLGDFAGVSDYEMMIQCGKLRVLLLSRHLSLRRALTQVKEKNILGKLRLARRGLAQLGLQRPRIAVAGLNPHAGEEGLFGLEEKREIVPAILKARKEGIHAEGPFSPDTIFRRASLGEFDIVLALYHDQAFIPVKMIGFEKAVTTILGLPFLRVSVIHGTAFEIAGMGIADASSFVEALRVAEETLVRFNRG